jgi:hypothetical protein
MEKLWLLAGVLFAAALLVLLLGRRKQPAPEPIRYRVGDITLQSLLFHNGFDW